MLIAALAAEAAGSIATTLAHQGARVHFACTDPDALVLAGLHRSNRTRGSRLQFVKTDLNDSAECEAVVADTLRAEGRLDILVNVISSAAPSGSESHHPVSADGIRTLFYITRAALPHFHAHGSVLNICIGASDTDHSSAALSRHAVAGFTHSLALGLSSRGVRVSSLWSPSGRIFSAPSLSPAQRAALPFAPGSTENFSRPHSAATGLCERVHPQL